MKTDPLALVRENLAGFIPPFSITGMGSVQDSRGQIIADQLFPGRDKLIVGALNYTATRHDEQVMSLAAHLLVELGYALDPRLDFKSTPIHKLPHKQTPFQAPPPRMLTAVECQKVVWKFMQEKNWDALVEKSL